MSFGFTQTGLNPGKTAITEPLGPYLYNGVKNSPALRRGLSRSLAMKLLTEAWPATAVFRTVTIARQRNLSQTHTPTPPLPGRKVVLTHERDWARSQLQVRFSGTNSSRAPT